jgi:uncharacterized protein
MLRLVLLIAAVVLLVWLVRSARRADKPAPPTPRDSGAERGAARDTMVACAHCGVHLPRGDALESGGLHFCGEPHRLEYQRRHPAP